MTHIFHETKLWFYHLRARPFVSLTHTFFFFALFVTKHIQQFFYRSKLTRVHTHKSSKMVKHNNVIPNQHFHKHWQERVRVTLDQPMRKKRRRLARQAKAERVAPAPVSGLLRPAVRCPTQRYNTKLRLGKGFTLEELKEVGISAKKARTIGIAVDFRRRNKSVESFQLNVARLKAYMARLVVFPRKAGKVKNGDASAEETASATQLKGPLMPVVQDAQKLETVQITDDMKNAKSVVYTLKQVEATRYITGKRNGPKRVKN